MCNITLEKLQTITVNCNPVSDVIVTCPDETFLGAFDCNNILEVPSQVNSLEDARTPRSIV